MRRGKGKRALAGLLAAALCAGLFFLPASAAPEGAAVGIKTGTAQTGVLENGEELLHFWYSGILWQGGVPRWCVTVLKESSASGQQAAAQVFREVAQGLLALGEEAAGS